MKKRNRTPGNAKRQKRKMYSRGANWIADSAVYDARESQKQTIRRRVLRAGYTTGRQSIHQLARAFQNGI